LGEKLLKIREGLGLSQSQMLRRLGKEENRNFISDYERGVRAPSLLELLEYARAAGVIVDVLIDDDLDLPEHQPQSQKVAHRVRPVRAEKKQRKGLL
jgi:transcriptional regulator with XRE-family HTH domain